MVEFDWEEYKDLAIACSFLEEAAVKAVNAKRAFQFHELAQKCVQAAAEAKAGNGE